MEGFLMERSLIKSIIDPVDFNTADMTGNRVSMKGRNRVTFICILEAATTRTAVTFTLQQHNAATAGTSKDLSVMNPYYHKVNAETYFTKVQPASAAAAYDLLTLVGDTKAIVVFEVLAEQLDVANSFSWVSINATDSGAASLGAVIAITDGEELKPPYDQAI